MRERSPTFHRSPRLLLRGTQPCNESVLGPLLCCSSRMREVVEVLVKGISRDAGEPDHASNRHFARFGCTRDGEGRCRQQSGTLLEEARFAGLPSIVLTAPRGGLEGRQMRVRSSDKNSLVLNGRRESANLCSWAFTCETAGRTIGDVAVLIVKIDEQGPQETVAEWILADEYFIVISSN